jgi:hypothetical protein
MSTDAPGERMPPRSREATGPASRVRRIGLPRTVGLLFGAAAAFFGLFWMVDLLWAGRTDALRTGGFGVFFAFDIETLQNTLGSLAQIIVAVLGIAITVVSIVVQLAATRYSSHIAGMFFRDRTNLAIMGFFVVACIDVVWVSLAVQGDLLPRASVIAALFVLTASLLMLIPYFAYVFDFLDPARVVARIGDSALGAAMVLERRGSTRRSSSLSDRQQSAASSIEVLADVAVNSVAQKDKVIATQAVATLRDVLVQYVQRKPTLPQGWFAVAGQLAEDADFAAMAPATHRQIAEERVWFEWKGLRQLRSVFAESLQHLPEVSHNVAMATRSIGEAAVATGDRAAVSTTLKFFNTYLRTSFNARAVRAAYNVLNEYRHLAESVVRHGEADLALEIARYFKYYGQTAHAVGLEFVTETAAYDLSVLCELAFDEKSTCHDGLLKTFLEVDKEAETKAEERALRGVRKAQVRLATFYLERGADPLARAIFDDMRGENAARLASIREELEAVTKKDFWEVTDRGINFDYLDAERKKQLAEFFAWFARGESGRATIGGAATR